jgi:hypothetical protein
VWVANSLSVPRACDASPGLAVRRVFAMCLNPAILASKVVATVFGSRTTCALRGW